MALKGLAPLPANMPLPRSLTPEEAKDPAAIARFQDALLTSLYQHDNGLRSYLANLEPAVETVDDNVTTLTTSVTNVTNTVNNISVSGDLGDPAWEWNQTDTSQFVGSVSYTNGTVTPVLQVVASTNVNQKATNYLEISSVGNGTAEFGYYLASDLAFPDTDRDVVIEWVTAPGGTTGYGGFSVLADDSGSAHSYNVFIGQTACWASQTESGSVTAAGTTPALVWDGSGECRGRLWLRGTKPASGAPRFHLVTESVPGGAGDGSYSTQIWRRDDFPTEPPNSSWDSLGCKKIGLALRASGGNALGSFRLTELRVYLL